MSVVPILREGFPETEFRKMIVACIYLALSHFFKVLPHILGHLIFMIRPGLGYEDQETERLSALPKVTLLISCKAHCKLNPAFDSQSGALPTPHS